VSSHTADHEIGLCFKKCIIDLCSLQTYSLAGILGPVVQWEVYLQGISTSNWDVRKIWHHKGPALFWAVALRNNPEKWVSTSSQWKPYITQIMEMLWELLHKVALWGAFIVAILNLRRSVTKSQNN